MVNKTKKPDIVLAWSKIQRKRQRKHLYFRGYLF